MRLLKPGGRALIYVWAFEQEYNKQKSKYLKDCNKEPPGNHSPTDNTSEDSQEPNVKWSIHTKQHSEDEDKTNREFNKVTDSKLSVHTNRTAFNSRDLLVPWHLKGGKGGGVEESGQGGKKDKRKEKGKKVIDNTYPNSLDSDKEPSSESHCHPDCDLTSEHESCPAPVFHRYYHVFQQGELEQLCVQVAGVRVQSSYHDQGNWCVILEKD